MKHSENGNHLKDEAFVDKKENDIGKKDEKLNPNKSTDNPNSAVEDSPIDSVSEVNSQPDSTNKLSKKDIEDKSDIGQAQKDASSKKSAAEENAADPDINAAENSGNNSVPEENVVEQDSQKGLEKKKKSVSIKIKDDVYSAKGKKKVLKSDIISDSDPAVEKVQYELLSKEDLVKMLEDMLNNKTYNELRDDVDTIRDIFTGKIEKELQEKKDKFIAEGGLEQDFKPADDPVNIQMNDLIEKYKTIRSDYNKQLEETKEENLAAKQEILEEFRILMEGQEGFDSTFRKFKQLQTKWFDIGIIPKQNVKDLWNSYNYFVDKFNDYVKINRDLRILDLKKNLDVKIKLCEKAELLAEDPNVANAFKNLQKLHTQWREAGPVPREDKDIIWERFKAATSIINKKHQNFQLELKDSLITNLKLKIGLCEKAEEIANLEYKEHGQWSENTTKLLAIQKEWKTIGYAPKKDNNQIYARFRTACDKFFENKAAFYSKTLEHQKENLEKKKQIVIVAEELRESTDWKSTTDKLIELQKQWKELGPVPRKDSDKLWKRFRSACDYFFNSKSEFFGKKDESYEENLKAKKELIKEMQKYSLKDDSDKGLDDIENFQIRYNEIGFVPVEKKDLIRDDFKKALDGVISKLNVEDEEKGLIRFRMKINSLIKNPRGDNKLQYERDKMMTKLQQLKNDIGIWENNIGFFKQTKNAEATLTDFNEKIEDAKSRIKMLEEKIKIIDDLEGDN